MTMMIKTKKDKIKDRDDDIRHLMQLSDLDNLLSVGSSSSP